MSRQAYSVQFTVSGKSIIVAYLLWWFLGFLGAHRLYLGRLGTAAAYAILFILASIFTFSIIGILLGGLLYAVLFIFWVIDAFLMPGIVAEINRQTGVQAPIMAVTTSADRKENYEILEKLHSLYEKGVITKEQYEARKDRLLAD